MLRISQVAPLTLGFLVSGLTLAALEKGGEGSLRLLPGVQTNLKDLLSPPCYNSRDASLISWDTLVDERREAAVSRRKLSLAKSRSLLYRIQNGPPMDGFDLVPAMTAMLAGEEIALRQAILRAVLSVKVEYGDHRNPRFWFESDGVFYPRSDMSATEALLDVGRACDDRGIAKDKCDAIYCTPLVQVLLLQGHIALASPAQRAAWDLEWQDLVERGYPIPNEIPGIGESRFWIRTYAEEEPGALPGQGYETSDLLPGDNVYFENPYFTNEMIGVPRYRGEEGSNVFFLGTRADGEGLIFHPYSCLVYTFTEYRQHMVDDWASTIDTRGVPVTPAAIKITHKRSPIVTP